MSDNGKASIECNQLFILLCKEGSGRSAVSLLKLSADQPILLITENPITTNEIDDLQVCLQVYID